MENLKKILVTGGAGFIGSHTIVELVAAGYDPIIIDNFSNSHPSMLNRINDLCGKEILCINADVCDFNQLESSLKPKEIFGILHFAAFKAVGESVEEPLKYYQNNILSLVNILKLAKKYMIQNIVFSSSCTVYGDPKGKKIVNELQPIDRASSPYGTTKITSELILQDFFNSGVNAKLLSLRYFNPIGAHPSGKLGELPQGKPNNLIPYVTQTAVGKLDQLTVYGNDYPTTDGTCVRDYIHVVDLAKAHVSGLRFLENLQSPAIEVVNVGTGKGNSVLEVISTFEEVSGMKLNWRMGPRREGDVAEIYADTTKAKDKLHWEAEYNLKDALNHAWRWEQNYSNEK